MGLQTKNQKKSQTKAHLIEMERFFRRSFSKVETKRTMRLWKYQDGKEGKYLSLKKGRSLTSVTPSQSTTRAGSTTLKPSVVASYAPKSTREAAMKET